MHTPMPGLCMSRHIIPHVNVGLHLHIAVVSQAWTPEAGGHMAHHADGLLHIGLVVQLHDGALALQLIPHLQLVDVLRHLAIGVALHNLQ